MGVRWGMGKIIVDQEIVKTLKELFKEIERTKKYLSTGKELDQRDEFNPSGSSRDTLEESLERLLNEVKACQNKLNDDSMLKQDLISILKKLKIIS